MIVNVATNNLNYMMNPSQGRRLYHSKQYSNNSQASNVFSAIDKISSHILKEEGKKC